jgi:hypothetical protein
MQTQTTPTYLDKRQVAKLLSCDERSIDRMRQRGLLRAIVLSPSMVRFDLADVTAAIEALKEPMTTDRSAA